MAECLKIFNGTDSHPRPEGNKKITVVIYADGTACEGQPITEGTRCRLTGFWKKDNGEVVFCGIPIESLGGGSKER